MTSPTCTHVNSYWRVHHVNTRMGIECVFVCMMCVWVCVCFVMFIAIWKHMYTREYTSIHPIKAPHVNSYEELLWDVDPGTRELMLYLAKNKQTPASVKGLQAGWWSIDRIFFGA